MKVLFFSTWPLIAACTAILLTDFALSQVAINCYNCMVPLGASGIENYCTDSTICSGFYCTKGPDAESNGILHSCTNTPPLDGWNGECKTVPNTKGKHVNCYCSNIEFCNCALKSASIIFLLIVFFVGVFLPA
ncbi:unnamed protein product [Caenorhabditis auriculariae]|uniref:Activin types I and II receptor domain-containing protein n=1 Tax=Caenorhabditis auriculariae TaxID=2777116 RepID=A0A8S1HCS9_9PELO|nr:unnamed protein product [Caenorhabditis auriculariae]